MSRESKIYTALWQKYRPMIISKMNLALVTQQQYSLAPHEFHAIGNRASYSFNLEINNGNLANNIDGSAVARDLYEVLKNSSTANEIMQGRYVKINMDKDFLLKINIAPV